MTTKAVKQETAAERYRRLKQQALEELVSSPTAKDEQLFDVETPSGMVWKCRRPNVMAFVEQGALPQALASKMVAKADGGNASPEAMFRSLTPEEQAKAIAFTSALVRYSVVSPQIVETPETDDQIGFDEVTAGDYAALAEWATSGGDEAKSLATFRRKRKRK